MTKEQLKEKFQPYLDNYGFVSLDVNDKSPWNGILFTSDAYVWDSIKGTEIFDYDNYVITMAECFVCSGLYHRHPNLKHILASHDDQVGMLYASKILKYDYHHQVYLYGKTHNWCYNNLDPNKFELKAYRLPHIVAFITWCAGEEPSWFHKLYFCAAIKMAVNGYLNKKESSQALNAFRMLYALKNENKLCSDLMSYFYTKIDVPELYRYYFSGVGGHPIADLVSHKGL